MPPVILVCTLIQAQARLFNVQSKADDILMETAKNLLAEIEQAIEDDDASSRS